MTREEISAALRARVLALPKPQFDEAEPPTPAAKLDRVQPFAQVITAELEQILAEANIALDEAQMMALRYYLRPTYFKLIHERVLD